MKSQASKQYHFITEGRGKTIKLWRNNIILLIALFALIFVAPPLDHFSNFVANTALIVVVITGIYAAEYEKRIFRILFSLGLLTLISMAVTFISPENRPLSILPFILVICSLIFSTIALVTHVSHAKTVEKSTVLCAINSYLLMGLNASVLFLILDLAVPASFTDLDAGPGSLSQYIYYGFVTLSTLGYGDITPSTPTARSLAVFVTLVGQLYLVIVMAMIIGKFLNSQNRK